MADMFRDSEEEGEEEEILLFLLLMRRRRRRLRAGNRQAWSRRWIVRKETRGAYANLIRELNADDPERFRQYHRLTRESFNEILAMFCLLTSKKDTHLSSALKASERLSVTLRFLATGLSFSP